MRVLDITGEALEREIEWIKTCPATRENMRCYAALLTIRHRIGEDRKEEEHEPHEHHLSMDDARRWAEKMKNADGSSGPHWTIAQTEQVKRENGMRCNAAEFFAVMNEIYSDFCVALDECGISELNTACYAKLAHAWINDQDAEEGKAKRYFEFIVK